jgi:hypothetical protein
MSDREKAQAAIDILSWLILSNGHALGAEQHNPRADADASDEYMRDRARTMKELRDIRERLENLYTGVVQ